MPSRGGGRSIHLGGQPKPKPRPPTDVTALIATAGRHVIEVALGAVGREPSDHARIAIELSPIAALIVHGEGLAISDEAQPLPLLRALGKAEDPSVLKALEIARGCYSSEGGAWSGLASALTRLIQFMALPRVGHAIAEAAVAVGEGRQRPDLSKWIDPSRDAYKLLPKGRGAFGYRGLIARKR